MWQKSILTSIVAISLLGHMMPVQAGSLSEILGISTSNTTSDTDVGKAKPVPVHEAFKVFPEQKGNQITIRFEVKDGYYLYQHKIKLELPEGVTATPLHFNFAPQTVNDPDFGQVPVFDKNFTATATLTTTKNLSKTDSLVKWQGCAKAGLCYPPEKTAFVLTNFSSVSAIAKDSNVQKDKIAPSDTTKTTVNDTAMAAPLTLASSPFATNQNFSVNQQTVGNNQVTSSLTPTAVAPANPIAPSKVTTPQDNTLANTNPIDNSVINDKNDNDPFGLVAHPVWAMALLFLAGIGLAFTACMYPMLPIVANIVARQHNPTAKKGLILTAGYGIGVATSYGILGALIAVFGQSLGVMNWLQNPVILLCFAFLFILLGLYMLDRLPIHLPAKVSHQLNKLTQVGENRLGSVTGSFITGFFSALVVSPCVSAPLAGALAGVAVTGNPVIGFLALFMLGLGLSLPLVLLGTTQGSFMPKAGAWMAWVKTGFALLLFAVALVMIERVFVTSWMLGIWAVWFAVVAGWAWQWHSSEQQIGKLLTRALSLVLATWSACLVVGMASGATDSWQPLQPLLTSTKNPNNLSIATQRINTLDQLTPLVASNSKVLVDVTADWCIECRIMDKSLFATPPTKLQNWQVVKLDVTEDTPQSRAVYEQLKVFGPPVLLYFDNGKLVYRQNGEVKRDEFEQALEKL